MQFFGSAGVGVQYDKYKKLQYLARGKMTFPVTTDGYLKFTIKGQSHLDKDFKQVCANYLYLRRAQKQKTKV